MLWRCSSGPACDSPKQEQRRFWDKNLEELQTYLGHCGGNLVHNHGIREVLGQCSVQFSHVQLFVTPCTAARQASLSIINSWSLLKLMSIELVMPSTISSSCHSVLLLPSIFPSIGVFSDESVLRIRWPKYWSFNFSISPSNEYSGLISYRITGLITLQSKGLSRVFSKTTVQKH